MRHLPLLVLATACGPNEIADPVETELVLEIVGLEDASDSPRADECAEALPVLHECDGPSPELRWSGAPDDAAGLVLIFDDPDSGDFPHWALWDLPATSTGLEEGASGFELTANLPGRTQELVNGFGWEGYLGSCPGSHNAYRWTLWAVDASFDFTEPSGNASVTFEALREAAKAASLGRARACHLYGPAVEPL